MEIPLYKVQELNSYKLSTELLSLTTTVTWSINIHSVMQRSVLGYTDIVTD